MTACAVVVYLLWRGAGWHLATRRLGLEAWYLRGQRWSALHARSGAADA